MTRIEIIRYFEKPSKYGEASKVKTLIRVDKKIFAIKGRWEDGIFEIEKIYPKMSDEMKEKVKEFIQEKYESYYAGQ
jgi:hypothetical protein